MPVRLSVEGGVISPKARARVARRASVILTAAAERPWPELSVLLTDDRHIRRLNRRYRSKDRATDVLAFAQREGQLGHLCGRLLGDVVVSVQTARRQAERQGRSLEAELTLLIAHGVLHLLGWDHDTPSRDRRMRRETQRLCDAAQRAASGRRSDTPRPRGGRAKSRK